jgi:hypothetical protein
MTNPAPSENVRPEEAPSRGDTRLGLLAAPAAFAVVALFNYVVAPAACQLGPVGFNVFRILAFVVTAAGVLVAVWGGYLAYRNVQRARTVGAEASDSTRFLGVGGIMLSVLFIALTIITGLSGLAMRPCEPV